ncbi:MAG: VanZ family protein [Clostridiales bacterium]|nr:VanZ family protein [Clostridiales bacterium]
MDLLFKNPNYFFETYLSVPPAYLAAAFAVCMALAAAIFADKMISALRSKRAGKIVLTIVFIAAAAAYLTLIPAITLLSRCHGDVFVFLPDPRVELAKIFDGNVHYIRGMVSNILLFVPLGWFVLWRCGRHVKIAYPAAALTAMAMSVTVELLQYRLGAGYAQTFDVICNTIGAPLGVLTGRIFVKITGWLRLTMLKYLIGDRNGDSAGR